MLQISTGVQKHNMLCPTRFTSLPANLSPLLELIMSTISETPSRFWRFNVKIRRRTSTTDTTVPVITINMRPTALTASTVSATTIIAITARRRRRSTRASARRQMNRSSTAATTIITTISKTTAHIIALLQMGTGGEGSDEK